METTARLSVGEVYILSKGMKADVDGKMQGEQMRGKGNERCKRGPRGVIYTRW